MILDGNLMFTGTSKGATGGIQSGAQTDAPTTGTQNASNILDLGLAGLPTSASGGGARDIGIGDNPMLKLFAQATAYTSGGTNIYVQLQGAPDNGSGSPGSFTTMWTGPTVTATQIAADITSTFTNQTYLANIDVPRPPPGVGMPRFLQLVFVSTGTFSGLQVEAGIVIDRLDQPVGTATGALSAYPAGITVAN